MNHPQRNMKRKFHDYLTLPTTEKLLTRAGFELAPSGIPSTTLPVESIHFHVQFGSVRES